MRHLPIGPYFENEIQFHNIRIKTVTLQQANQKKESVDARAFSRHSHFLKEKTLGTTL